MTEVQAVVSDMDGTLLGDNKLIHEQDIGTIRRLRQRGVKVLLATGRHLTLVDLYAQQLGGVDLILSSNGANLYDPLAGRYVKERFFTPAQLERVQEFARWSGVLFFAYTRDFACYLRQDERINIAEGSFTMGDGPDFGHLVKIMDEVPDVLEYPVVKVIFPQLDKAHLPRLEEDLGDLNLELYRRDIPVAEIGPTGGGKGPALAEAAQLLGFDLRHTIAMGDSFNDLSMLRAVGHPVVPVNGITQALELAEYRCAHNDHAPLTDAVRHYCPQLLD